MLFLAAAVGGHQHVGQQDVDAIAGIDEARDRRGRRGRHADGAQAGLQNGGKKATRARHDDVALDDRFADMELAARDGAHKVADWPLAFDDVGRRQVALRPRLPTQVVGLYELSGADGGTRHQHLRRGLGDRALPAHLGGDGGALGLQPGAGQKGGGASDDNGEQQEDDALAVHGAPCAPPWPSVPDQRCRDPQAAGRDRRAIGQAAAQPGAQCCVGGRRLDERTERRAGQHGNAQHAADQRRDQEEIRDRAHAGEQARSRQQLHITAAQRAGSEGHGAGGNHSGRAGQRQADGN